MDIKQNKNFRKKINNFWFYKTSSIVVFLLATIISTIIHIGNFGNEFLGIPTYNWIIGYVISYLIAYITHLINFFNTIKITYVINFPYKKLLTKINHGKTHSFLMFLIRQLISNPLDTEAITKTSVKFEIFFSWCYRIVSPDYFYATTFKALLWNNNLNVKCKKRENKKDKKHNCQIISEEPDLYDCELLSKKERRKNFILYSNWTNVIIASLFVAVALLCERHSNLLMFIFPILTFHSLSRIIEIVMAFYKDVVRAKMDKGSLDIGYRSSNLKRGHRISLAFHSYIEIVILYSLIYFISMELGYFYTLPSSNDMESYLDFLLYSLSVSAFNFSFTMDFSTFQKLVHVSQVFSNITLVVLSIATYIGMKDSMSEIEKVKWKEDVNKNYEDEH
nr:hypothetical protein [Heyndrickxia oleronia]